MSRGLECDRAAWPFNRKIHLSALARLPLCMCSEIGSSRPVAAAALAIPDVAALIFSGWLQETDQNVR
jgi:hypothetical protein